MPPFASPDFPAAFAAQWIANWNARDVEAVLSHFRDDCVFVSPVAQAVVGTARIEGKAALRDYWTAALQKHASLHFTLDDFAWDAARRTLAVMYISRVGERITSCSELMTFDSEGRQTLGRAYYGAVANA
jgi:ketosteroid isomerase-like protein